MRAQTPRQRWTLALAAAVLVVCAVGAWMRWRPVAAPPPEPSDARVTRQIRTLAGPRAELRYAEPGQRRAVCGYIGRTHEGPPVSFVSIPNRILFSDDPLPKEFRELRLRYCPGFMQGPSNPVAMR